MRALSMSHEKYLEFLKDLDITEDEKHLIINHLIELSEQLYRGLQAILIQKKLFLTSFLKKILRLLAITLEPPHTPCPTGL